MARSTPSNSPSLPSDVSPNSAPTSKKLGILSRTLFHSPEINFTFPLRIRDWHKQDVALIGDRFVHIEEVRHGTFHHIATKADFPAKICAAQVIGSTDYEPLDGDPSEDDQQHAHALLLSLENHTLVLLTMTRDVDGRDVFAIKPMQTSVSQHLLSTVGKYLAVDPYSRALAVGAAVDTIEFMRMNPRSQWAPDGSNALRAQYSLRTQMKIVKMDFLHVHHRAAGIIQLLVFGYRVENNPRAYLSAQLWVIDPSQSSMPPELLNSLDTGVPLDHGVPQILIPLRRSPGAFVLVCDEKIATYSVQAGHIRSKVCRLVREFYPESCNGLPHFLGSSKGAPLWRAWARPPRNDRFRNARGQERELDSECLYIAREDGALCYLYVKPDLSFFWGKGGTLNGIIGSAFNHDGGNGEAPDGLIFGGSLSDGGIYMAGQTSRWGIDARSRESIMTFRQTAALYNWAPFIDLTSVPAEEQSGYLPSEPRLLSTSGKLPYGAITELRFGCEAIVRTILRLPARIHLTRLVGFSARNGQPLVLLSSPTGHTWMMHGAELSYMDENANNIASFAEEETIAASKLGTATSSESFDDVFFVGPKTLSVLRIRLDTPDGEVSVEEIAKIHHSGSIVATVDGGQELALIATPTALSLYHFKEHERSIGQLGSSISLDRVPVCAEMFHLGRSYYAIISDDTGRLSVFGINRTGLHTMEDSIQLGEGPQICCALAILPIPGVPGQARALCGQRGGGIVVLRLQHDRTSGNLRIKLVDAQDSRTITGTLQVDTCHRSSSNDGSGVVLSGSQALYVKFRSPHTDVPMLNRIYLTDPADTAFSPGPLRAMCCIAASRTDSADSDGFFCLDDSSIYTTLLNPNPKALPLRTPLGRQPNRIVYSDERKSCFVATIQSYVKDKKRYLLPVVVAHSMSHTASRAPEVVCECGFGETISSLTLWERQSIRQDGSPKTTQYLIVNTIDRNESLVEAGTVRILRLGASRDGLNAPSPIVQRENRPITAMCSFDDENILYCSDSRIKRLRLSRRNDRDSECQTSSFGAPSGGIYAQYMSANPPFVHISTSCSLVTFHFDPGEGKLTEVYRDDRTAEGLSHLIVAVHNRTLGRERCSALALFSDKSGTVAGHWLGSSTTGKHVMPRAFEANLPVSMTKFVECDVRPRWKLVLPNNTLVRQTMERHIVTSNVLGTATNGSLWSFAVLNTPVWRLLKFVQHMCLRDGRISPGLQLMDWHLAGHIMPEDSPHAERYHIDGDMLSRLVGRPDAEDVLADMLHTVLRGAESGSGDRTPPLDFDSAFDKERAFCRLVSELRQDRGQTEDSMSPPAVEHLQIEDRDAGRSRHGGQTDNHDHMVTADVFEVVGLIRWLVDIPF